MATSRYPFPATPDGWYGVAASRRARASATCAPLHYLGRELVGLPRRGRRRARLRRALPAPRRAPRLRRARRAATASAARSTAGASTASGCLVEVPRLGARRRPCTPRALAGLRAQRPRLRLAPRAGRAAALRRDRLTATTRRTGRRGAANAYRVRVHVQDLTENILDRAHFVNVHDMAPPDRRALRRDASTGRAWSWTSRIKVTAVAEAGVDGALAHHELRARHRRGRGEAGRRSTC